MSSNWSEIRSRAGNDPIIDVISDLQQKANQIEATDNIVTTDKISPIRILRSKVEIFDKAMMTGYVRPRNTGQTYYISKEPDGDHLRLHVKFDSACDTLPDYSMMDNEVEIGFDKELPVLLKGTEDDGITAGDMASVIDGSTQYYRAKITPKISIKQMVLDGKPGITIIYRNYPLFIKNEARSSNTQRTTLFYAIENDQAEYACKAQIDDAGYIYFYFRYNFVNYYVRSVDVIVTPPDIPDYFSQDYHPVDYDAAEEYYNISFPTQYIDMAFQFNFSTKARTLFINGVMIPTKTTSSVVLIPPAPTPMFPTAFPDPPPPPPTPEPYFLPLVEVYNQPVVTNQAQINAITTTQQVAFYHVAGSVPQTDPITRIMVVDSPPPSAYEHLSPDEGGSGVVNYNPIIPSFATQGVVHKGGPTYGSANIYIIFDAGWNTQTTPYTKQQVIDQLNALFNSTYFDALIQYGTRRPASFYYRENLNMFLPTSYVMTDVKVLVDDSIKRNIVPSNLPNENHNIYVVISAAGKSMTIAGNPQAQNYVHVSNSNDPENTAMVMGGVVMQTILNDMTRWIIRNILAAITNPLITFGTGWVLNGSVFPGLAGAAIGKSGQDVVVTINNVGVNPYYSNVDSKLVPPPNAPTWVSCPINTTWNNTTQFCVGSATTNAPVTGAETSIAKISSSDNSSAILRKNSADNKIVANVIKNDNEGFGKAVVGKVISKAIFQCKAESSPTGRMYARVWNSNGDQKGTIGEYDTSNVNDSDWDSTTFSGGSNAHSCNVGDRIGIEYTTGTTSDIIKVRRKSSNVSSDDSVRQSTIDTGDNSGNWSENSSYQVACEVFSGSGGGSGGGGGTVDPGEDKFFSDIPLCNDFYGVSNWVGQLQAPSASTISKIPTILEFMIWRNSVATSGTYRIGLYDKNNYLKTQFMTANVSSLPTVIPRFYNIVWQDVNNAVSIAPNDYIAINVDGVVDPARVFVMTNKNYRGEMTGGTSTPNPNPVPIVLAPIIPAAPTPVQLKDYGGNKISGATVHLIFWGRDWNTRTSPFSKSDIVSKITQTMQSKVYDGLIQYGIKRPKMGVSYINTTYPDYQNFEFDDLTKVIGDSVKRKGVPNQTPDNKQMYLVIPRNSQKPGELGEGAGGSHGFSFSAFHNMIDSTLNPGEIVYIIQGWVRHYPIDDLIAVATHEIIEMITDPQPSWKTLGLYAANVNARAGSGVVHGEICDSCPGYDNEWHGTSFNQYWSNQEQQCISPDNAPSYVSCPAGTTWDEKSQNCVGQPPGTVTVGGYYANDFDGENSHIVHRNDPPILSQFDNIVDIVMRMRTGGGEFIGYIELDNRRKRVGIKVNEVGSVFIGKIPTKMEFSVKRIGVQLPPSNLYCNIRDQLGNLKVAMGFMDASTIPLTNLPITFINTQSTYAMKIGDVVSLEYNNGTVTNQLLVRASNGQLNAGDADKTMLFEGVPPNINFPSTLFNRDIAGTVYSGGKTDLQARPIRGVRVATALSVLYDKVISEVRIKLKGTGLLPLGNTIKVKIIRNSDKVTVRTLGQLDMNSVSTTDFVEYYFFNPDNDYRMKVGDMVGIEFSYGNPENFIEVRTSTGEIYDGGNTVMFEYNGISFTNVPFRDLSGTMSIGGYTVTPDPAIPTPQPPFHYAHEWFIGAATTPDSGALVEPSELKPLPNSHYNNISKEFRIYDMLLTENQLTYYYENRFTITPIPKGRIEVVGHDIVPFSTS